MAQDSFGGLCESGHDVAAGVPDCPECGAPVHGPAVTPPLPPDPRPAPLYPPAPPGGWPPPPGPGAAYPGYPGYGPFAGWGPAYPGPAYSAPASPSPGPAYPAPAYPRQGYPAPGGPPPRPGEWPGGLPSYWSYGPPTRATNGLAVASLVLGVLWLWWLGSVLAVVLGHTALAQIRSRGENGRGMAIAGLTLGYVGLAVGILSFFLITH
jgi:hypothetical protein